MTCPKLPIVATFGKDEEDAARHAVDAVETVLSSLIDDGEDVPAPDKHGVQLPLLTG